VKLTEQGLILVFVPLALELGLVVVLTQIVKQSEGELEKQLRSKAVIARIERLPKLFDDAALSTASSSISQSDSFKTKYRKTQNDIEKTLSELSELVKGDPMRRLVFLKLESASKEGLAAMKAVDALPNSSRLSVESAQDAARKMYAELEKTSKSLRDASDSILLQEEKIQTESPESQLKAQNDLFTAMLAGTALNIIIAFLLVFKFSQGAGRSLAALSDNAVRLAAGEPLYPPQSGEDEFARLDNVFHKMAEMLAESARKERAIVENAVDVICSIDKELRFTELSPAALRSWGFQPKELIGQRYMSIVAEAEQAETLSKIKEAMEKAGGSSFSFQNRIKCKDGQLVDALWSASWSRKDEVLFCVAHDTTKAKQLERLKQQFVAMVSHDLRTPLTSLSLFLEGMQKGLYGEITDGAMKRVTDSHGDISRLIALINQLLDIDKLEAGKLSLNLGDNRIAEIVERSVASIRAVANRKKIELTIDAQDIGLEADGDRLVQVIVNLLGNAIHFSPEKSRVSISAKIAGENILGEEAIEVRIQDCGPGIKKEDQEKIFDRFSQLDAPQGGRQKTGTGLGLAISKMIVEEHGGRLWVESEAGAGSTFCFAIPRYHPA